jgi:hypothetical protein
MRNWLEKLKANSWLTNKLLMVVILVGACVIAFFVGRRQNVIAQGRLGEQRYDPITKKYVNDSDRRIVAYLYQNEPVTREELGEYLIARLGAERLEFLVNRKIVEMECGKQKIYVSDAEVDARFQEDLRSLSKGIPITPKEFEANILRRFNKTLFEWKEDVIRPKLMMEKLVRPVVAINEQDVKDGFEARFGPKVECRMIVLEKGNESTVQQVWEDARKGRKEFLAQAAKQSIPNLAQAGGVVPPIHKHFGDKNLEVAAFRLRPDEVSAPILMPDGTKVILMCDKHIPADLTRTYEAERMQIHREVQDMRIAQEIPKVFAKMRERASPQFVLASGASYLGRMEGPVSSAPRTIESLPPMPVKAPEGYQPMAVPNVPLAAPMVPLPKIDNLPQSGPVEKK